MKKKTLLIKTADLCIRIHYKYPYIEQQCETWRVNEGYEPDIEVSVTDEEIETEYAGYRAESVSRALCEISRSSDVKTAYGMHMAHRGWEKKSLEVKVLRRFRQFALLNGEKKIRFKRLLIRKL